MMNWYQLVSERHLQICTADPEKYAWDLGIWITMKTVDLLRHVSHVIHDKI